MVQVHCISGSQELKIDFLTKNIKNLLVRNHWTNFNIILQTCSFGDLLLRCSSHLDSSKNMAARGRGLFSLYIYLENFKNLLVRNHWTDLNIILQKCSFGQPLPRLFKPFGFVRKHGPMGWGLFSLYIYIENFKNLLVRNHWTNFSITWQKYFLGDTLPRLFKQSRFVKKHGSYGWAYFPYLSIQKTLMSFLSETTRPISI